MKSPQSLAQKLIARASARASVAVGEVVTCRVDLAMFHDSSGPRRLQPMLEKLGVPIWDRERVVLVLDHYVPAQDPDAQQIVELTRRVARDWKLPHVIDSEGICHVVLPERGHLVPGMFCVGGDSHSPTGGAFATYMFGIGATEMLGVCATGEIWVQVPRTVRMQWDGRLSPGVTAKDMMLHLIGRLGMNGGAYQAVEFGGTAVQALDMAERMTLSNMSAELGAQVGLCEADDTLIAHLRGLGVDEARLHDAGQWHSDPGSADETHCWDATALAPQVAAPHSPANTQPVEAYAEVRPDIAYIGACTGAKLQDLRAAARVLKGRRVAAGVQLMVAPASRREQQQAEREGTLQILIDAGAQVLPNSCGACAGYGATFGAGQTVISSTARNFKGRMGPASVQVYLASPYTVAASALRGRVTDPREVLA